MDTYLNEREISRKGLPLAKFRIIWTFKWKMIEAYLVAQWWRICLPRRATWVRFLVQGDPTCRGASKLMYNYWACAPEPGSPSYWSPRTLELMLPNKRCRCSEKPTHHNESAAPAAAARAKPTQQQRHSTARIKEINNYDQIKGESTSPYWY